MAYELKMTGTLKQRAKTFQNTTYTHAQILDRGKTVEGSGDIHGKQHACCMPIERNIFNRYDWIPSLFGT